MRLQILLPIILFISLLIGIYIYVTPNYVKEQKQEEEKIQKDYIVGVLRETGLKNIPNEKETLGLQFGDFQIEKNN